MNKEIFVSVVFSAAWLSIPAVLAAWLIPVWCIIEQNGVLIVDLRQTLLLTPIVLD